MWKSDIICPECGAGYRRIVITSSKGAKGEYRCLTCDHVLELFDGSFDVLIRLTIPPVKVPTRLRTAAVKPPKSPLHRAAEKEPVGKNSKFQRIQ